MNLISTQQLQDKEMFKKISFLLLSWLIPIAASAAIITTDYTNTGSNSWTVDYSIENDNAYQIEEVSIFFDYLNYENISILSSPNDWDSIIFQPDASFPDDGLFDSLALGAGINQGDTLSGFTLSFDWIGSNSEEMSQYFEVVDPATWDVLDSGYTTNAITGTVDVPEPHMILLFAFGLAMLAFSRSKGAKVAMLLGAMSITAQSQAETINTIHATDYKLIDKKRVGRTTFNFTYEVAFKNNGSNYSNVIASVYSDNPDMNFADTEISIASFYQNSTMQNKDTVTITVDRRKTVNLDDLAWSFTADVNESETSLIAGRFIDEAVEGLYYTSPSASGYTDYNGTFMCHEDEPVAFYAGNIKLGESVCQNLVTPISLMGNELTGAGSLNDIIENVDFDELDSETLILSDYGELSDERVVEVLRLLQTLDDAPKSERILIGEGSLLHDAPEVDLSQYDENGLVSFNVEDLNLPEIKKPLLTAEEAVENFLYSYDLHKGIKRNLDTMKDNFTHNLNIDLSTKREVATDEKVTYLADNYLEQAYLSNRIYQDYLGDLNKSEDDWRLVHYQCHINGFKAGLYQKGDTYNIVIAGTAGVCTDNTISKVVGMGVDIYSDLHLLINAQPDHKNEIESYSTDDPLEVTLTTPQALTALYFLEHDVVSNAIQDGKVSYITGHSLGGGLAAYLGLYTGIQTITFNPAPIPFTNASDDLFRTKGLVSTGEYTEIYLKKDFVHSNKIVNVISQGDPVSYLGESLLEIQSLAVQDIDNDGRWRDTYHYIKEKLNMQNSLLGLDHVMQGETFYLPILFDDLGSNHSIAEVNNLLKYAQTPPLKEYSASARVIYSNGESLYLENQVDYYNSSVFQIPESMMNAPANTSTKSEFLVFSTENVPIKGLFAEFWIEGPSTTPTNPTRIFSLELFKVHPDFEGDASDCQYTFICSVNGSSFLIELMSDDVGTGDNIYSFDKRIELPSFSNIQGRHKVEVRFSESHVSVYYDNALLSRHSIDVSDDATFSGFYFQITGSGSVDPYIVNYDTGQYLTKSLPRI
jgi:hypothetical protein